MKNFNGLRSGMGSNLLLFVFVTSSMVVQGQLDVVNGFTVEEYVNEVLLGEGVVAFNITYAGGMDQLGKMVQGSDSDYAFDEGLVMSTENARGIGCSSAPCTDCLANTLADPSLLEVANSVPELIGQSFTVTGLHDVSILEFDFMVTGDSIGFNYIFGSDEYLTWINTQYNDVFGFFLSGPGIEGPYESPSNFPGGAINIAGVPNSDPNLPITVSSVNSTLNSEYFNYNIPYDGICINGYTSVFHAGYPVECGLTYHIKLAIADGSDGGIESVVILEKGSFVSNVPVLFTDAVDVGSDGGDELFEGCGNLQWTFTRPEEVPLDQTYQILMTFGIGEAENGIDFGQVLANGDVVAIPDTIVFEPGVAELSFTISAIEDELSEGSESLIATISSIESCSDGFMYLSYEIFDEPSPIEIEPFSTISCSNVQIIVAPTVTGGFGNYEYDWSCSNSSAPFITVNSEPNWECILTVSDTCGIDPVSAVNTIELLDAIPLSMSIMPEDVEVIPGDSVELFVSVDGGWNVVTGNYQINWYINGELTQSGPDTTLSYIPDPYDEVFVEVEDGCGNEDSDEMVINVSYEVEAIITALDESMMGPDTATFYACMGSELAWSPSASTATTDTVLYYMWNWGDGDIEYSLSDTVFHEWSEPGIYQITLTMAGLFDSFDVSEPFVVMVVPKPNVIFQVDSPICLNGIGEAEVTIFPGSFTQTAYYSGNDTYLADSMATTYEFSIDVDGFSENAEVENCSDVKKIRASMEHAFVGALDMWVTCPDGSELWLLKNNQGASDDCNGGSDVDDANLGQPIEEIGNDAPGTPFTYTWRPTGLYVIDDANNSMLEGGVINIGSYTSCNDWCSLQGCPMNGEWTLHVATVEDLGDGHLFDWNIQFEHNELDALGLGNDGSAASENSGFVWNSLAESAVITEDESGLYATYEPFALGQHAVQYVSVDAFGCTTTKNRQIQINDGLGFEVVGGPNPNACASQISLGAELVNTSYTECPGMPYSNSWCVGNNVDTVFTICPMIQGDGTYMHIMFNSAQLDSLGDSVTIYDGPDTSYPVLGTYSGDLSLMEWGSEDPSGCLTLRVETNGSQSCGDGTYPPMDFTIDCNEFFLDVVWNWWPGELVEDSTAQNTIGLSDSLATEYIVSAFYEDQPTCYSSDTLHVISAVYAEWLAFHPDCDVSNGTLVIDVDAPGYSGFNWNIDLVLQDSISNMTYSQPSTGDPLAFLFLPNGVYDLIVSNENCDYTTQVELDADENENAQPCGCTYAIFDNYDPEAVIDDGSCAFTGGGGGGGGCAYQTWCEQFYEDDCQADLNEDGVVGISDFLEFMSAFGTDCPETLE